MHRPEFTLQAGGFRRLGGQGGLVVDVDQWEVPVYDAHTFWKISFELRQHGRKGCASGSLKVAVFDYGDRSVTRP